MRKFNEDTTMHPFAERLLYEMARLPIIGKKIDLTLMSHFGRAILLSMKPFKWCTFQEIVDASQCPRLYARRILINLAHWKRVEVRAGEHLPQAAEAKDQSRSDVHVTLQRMYEAAEYM